MTRRCSKCGKTWPISAWFAYPPPKDMTKYVVEKKEPATYAKWADRIPFISVVPKLLPNWPRWARILTLIILIVAVVSISVILRG